MASVCCLAGRLPNNCVNWFNKGIEACHEQISSPTVCLISFFWPQEDQGNERLQLAISRHLRVRSRLQGRVSMRSELLGFGRRVCVVCDRSSRASLHLSIGSRCRRHCDLAARPVSGHRSSGRLKMSERRWRIPCAPRWPGRTPWYAKMACQAYDRSACRIRGRT